MATIADFNYFDPQQEYVVTYGDLPHWEQPGATYFITFRTADSLPQTTLDLWKRERDDWLSRQTNDSSSSPWFEKYNRLSPTLQEQFRRIFHYKLEQNLDCCHGACPLEKQEHSSIVAKSLKHFDGQRYHLGDFIVMPNHVHVFVCFFKEIRLREQCYSWKHYMAAEINKLQHATGEFWQTESFDHLVRDVEHFRKNQKYISKNPTKAGLSEGQYIHYQIDG
jgi:menaquinone-specific isochorismate synthase